MVCFSQCKDYATKWYKKTGTNKLPCNILKIKNIVNRVCALDQKGTIPTGLLRRILKEMILKYNKKWSNNQIEFGYLTTLSLGLP